MEASADPEAKIRAHYRLGLLNINKAGMLVKSKRHFEKVAELDGEFCKHQVNLRLAEIQYLLD